MYLNLSLYYILIASERAEFDCLHGLLSGFLSLNEGKEDRFCLGVRLTVGLPEIL
jgi:hypothetical protein